MYGLREGRIVITWLRLSCRLPLRTENDSERLIFCTVYRVSSILNGRTMKRRLKLVDLKVRITTDTKQNKTKTYRSRMRIRYCPTKHNPFLSAGNTNFYLSLVYLYVRRTSYPILFAWKYTSAGLMHASAWFNAIAIICFNIVLLVSKILT